MQRQVFEYDQPDRFVAGTVGEPGQRTFYLQASGRGRVTSVALEKQQVAALAERVDELLDEVLRRSGGTAVPAMAPSDAEDSAPLDSPVSEEFRVGTMAIAWDADAGLLMLEAHALVEADPDADDSPDEGADDDPDEGADAAADADELAEVLEDEVDTSPFDDADTELGLGGDDEAAELTAEPDVDVLRVRLTAAQARAFAKRATRVVGAGRPPCPFCGLPLDPSGHVCPRQNGYLRR